MRSLELLIRSAKENDENAMLDIIEKFQPLIHRYFTKSRYNEDVKSELVLKLIGLVKRELDLASLHSPSEGALVKYIASSLHRHYLAVAMENSKKSANEILCEDDGAIDVCAPPASGGEMENSAFFGLLREILTEREFDCVYNIEIMGYTAEELSREWRNSKQAVNQCKRRAFAKIRQYYESQ